MNDVTRILEAIEQGDPRASGELLPLVYRELRQLASQRLAQEKPGQTLQATDLVHEAYLRLVGKEDICRWDGRGHFFAAAAEAMRRILVENARRKTGPKAGGGRQRVELATIEPATDPRVDVIALDEALSALEAKDKRKAELVRLRYFAGFSIEQAAETLGVSVATANNDWSYARSWLRLAMLGEERAEREG
jgi:RNA polymerase sigma factor (TIGR02999 family)